MKFPTEIMYIGCSKEQIKWGGNDDPSVVLTVGEVYRIRIIEIHDMHTKIELMDFPGLSFNSVCFGEVLICQHCNKSIPKRAWCDDCQCCFFCCKAGDTIPTHVKIITEADP